MTKATEQAPSKQVPDAPTGEPDSHWFASSCFHWEVGYDLTAVLTNLRKRNRHTLKPKRGEQDLDVAIWRVPGPTTAGYKINNYGPQVEGVESIGHSDIRQEH